MLDYSNFASKIIEATARKDIPDMLILLDKLTLLKREKSRLLSSLSKDQFVKLLSTISNKQDALNNIVIKFYELGQIKNIDRLDAAFRRRIKHENIDIIEIESASSNINKNYIESNFDKNTLFIYKLNPQLLAGIKIKTSDGEFEYSANQHLIDLKEALVA